MDVVMGLLAAVLSAFSWGTTVGSVSVVTVISTLSGGIAAILGFFSSKSDCQLPRC